MCVKLKSESQVYVRDLRKVMLMNKKRLKYPKKYHKIVKDGEIITTDHTDSEGNVVLKLLYGKKDKKGLRPAWTLVHVATDECHGKAYYTMHMLLYDSSERRLSSSCYEPFGFTSVDLKKYTPVIDIKKTDDPGNPYQLTNTLYIARKGCSVSDESGEVDANSRNEKALNGKQLYTAFYGKQDPSFFVIRDEHDKIELDKTILCFSVSLFVYTVIFIRMLLTFIPMKFGECLLHLKNPVSKVLGNIFFTPFVPLKFIVDLSAIIVKMPILLFVANEKKYGDKYWVLWKHELLKCFHELSSDCSVIKNGKRPDLSDYDEYFLIGTWDELNVRHRCTYSLATDFP